MSKFNPLQSVRKRFSSVVMFVRKRWYIAVILLILAIVAWFRFTAKEPETYTVGSGTLSQTVSSSGETTAGNQVTLQFAYPSKVIWRGVEKGEYVDAYQTLATVDRRELQKGLEDKLLAYMDTRWDFEQTFDDADVNPALREKYTLTDEEKRILEKSQFGLDRSVLAVEIASLALEQSVLVSPISGTVSQIEGLMPGQQLSNTTLSSHFIKIVDLASVYFQANLDEADYGSIRTGQEVVLTLDAFPDVSFDGIVSAMGIEGVETSGGGTTIPVDITFTSNNLPVIPGLNGQAEIYLGEKQNAITIPKRFILYDNSEPYVYVRKDSTEVRTPITLGISSGESVEVTSGLEPNQTIILK